MIQRAPRWMWFALGAVAGTLMIVGIALTISNRNGNVDSERVVRVTLRGFENCSDEVDLTLGPEEGKNFFLGPSGAQVRWLDYDGEEGPVAKWWGPKGGRICFLGPTGETVTVRQTPTD